MKILAILIASIMIFGMLGFASAQYSSDSSNASLEKENKTNGYSENKTLKNETDSEIESETENETGSNESRGIGQELSAKIEVEKEELKEGNYTGPLGQLLDVKELSNNLRELREGNVSVKTELNITFEKDDKNETHFKANLSNGKESEIKVMPETASKRALERLRLKVCSEANNCTIVLKEVGKNNETSANYEVKADQNMRVLGLFKAKAHIEAQVDSDTGKIVSARIPWWTSISTTA